MGRHYPDPAKTQLGVSRWAALPASALTLIAVNALPLLGVLFAGWDVFTIVILYWFETAVIGGINILRMLTAKGDFSHMAANLLQRSGLIGDQRPEIEFGSENDREVSSGAMQLTKLFIVPFFCVHFGIFMFGHLIFIVVMLGSGGSFLDGSLLDGGSPFDRVGGLPSMVTPMMAVSLLALLGSHLFSFFHNYIGKGEYLTATAPGQMMRPYGRVVVMHIAIIFGGFATVMLGQNVGLLLILVAGKTVIDLKMHLRDHTRAQAKAAAAGGATL